LPSQHEVDQQQGEAECQVDLTADDLLPYDIAVHSAGARRQGFMAISLSASSLAEL
jgi:hypothetical protein